MAQKAAIRSRLLFGLAAISGVAAPCPADGPSPARTGPVKPAALSVHVIDTMTGNPAAGLRVVIARSEKSAWTELGRGQTDESGRIARVLPDGMTLRAGVYRMTFETGGYFARRQVKTFYPEVPVVFEVTDPERHHHLPLILSPNGYSTYRGN
jgi:5-hydroxyisourate hydrolase